MTERFCRMLEELTAEDLPVAGGKGANLGELVRSGLPVPAGFVVTTAAYTLAVEAVAGPGYDEVLDVELPAAVRDAIGQAYEAMGEGRVAVRSSATAEDLPGAAFAGQQDTFLGVEGLDAVLEAVRLCWASLWGERAVAYRARLGLDDAAVAIAVVVQTGAAAQPPLSADGGCTRRGGWSALASPRGWTGGFDSSPGHESACRNLYPARARTANRW